MWNLWNFDIEQVLNKNSLSLKNFFFNFANPSVDMDFSGRLFLNFYEIAVCLLSLLFIKLLFIIYDIIYDIFFLAYLYSTFCLDTENWNHTPLSTLAWFCAIPLLH